MMEMYHRFMAKCKKALADEHPDWSKQDIMQEALKKCLSSKWLDLYSAEGIPSTFLYMTCFTSSTL